ncbi:hypothetical protein ElyMa_005734900 [Elysia marginata]|uniref:Uncharacterized protein n=1 Tax=Elysia marginata TaxID=1093978 RepID=A0AAV4FJZ8_9GAST|nr:hypothetical protein ElyMa_005734900 [Elysia marginata]
MVSIQSLRRPQCWELWPLWRRTNVVPKPVKSDRAALERSRESPRVPENPARVRRGPEMIELIRLFNPCYRRLNWCSTKPLRESSS